MSSFLEQHDVRVQAGYGHYNRKYNFGTRKMRHNYERLGEITVVIPVVQYANALRHIFSTYRKIHEPLDVLVQRFECRFMRFKVFIHFVRQIGIRLGDTGIRIVMILGARADNIGIYQLLSVVLTCEGFVTHSKQAPGSKQLGSLGHRYSIDGM